MTADLKPITVWSLGGSPNPWKPILILEELSIPYDVNRVGLAEVKQEPYISLNPNGRVPTIEDPNTGLTSGACVEYLIETYDKQNTLSYPKSSLEESTECRTWSYFQYSGQGPYFGQLGWFGHHHPEKIASVIERYRNEVLRVNGVIDLHLTRQGTGHLVGDKCTYADLMFVPYAKAITMIIAPEIDTSVHKTYTQWIEIVRQTSGEEGVKVMGGCNCSDGAGDPLDIIFAPLYLMVAPWLLHRKHYCS
ncbi:glutathione-s-transferase theta, gst [Xylariales sp. AK1849]|nr:glutathione-s-transferase theta, gst [Xylariales sp. AK1849]